jgi:cytochrome oxidase Cu insertion factor (SCO1/SenC/PrrC family)
MPGMGGSVAANDPLVVGAFHALLRQQAIVCLVLVVVVLLVQVATLPYRQAGWVGAGAGEWAEHPARRLLRVSFGLLWIIDGLLQAQKDMPIGLPTSVVDPAAAGAPAWVKDVVSFGTDVWVRHPVSAAASVVWIQIGVGLLLLLAPRGRASRLAGAVSIGWGLVVWVFGEAFGGVLSPGQTWIVGFPGSSLLYVLAGVAVALPASAWTGRKLGRWFLRAAGVFYLGMALLEAWPGRGFWRGGATGGLSSMIPSMAQTPQPGVLTSVLRWTGSLDTAHGWAINLGVVLFLVAAGTALLLARGRLLVWTVGVVSVASLAVWVIGEDLGVLGGVGTDPNSMIPEVLLLLAGWLAATRDAVARTDPAAAPDTEATPALAGRTASRIAAVAMTLGAFAVVLVGAVPMASASVNDSTSTILTEALNGSPELINGAAPGFDLTDQSGRAVSLRDFRGRAVAMTFLDPVCTNDCPLIAQEFRDADDSLSRAERARTAFVAIVANPVYRSQAVMTAFDDQEDLAGIPNWYYLTGSVDQLQKVWAAYGVEVKTIDAGSMVAHSDTAVVINPRGRVRAVINANPGSPDNSSDAASLGTLVVDQLHRALS